MIVSAPLTRVLVVDDEPSLLDDYRYILGAADRGELSNTLAALEADLFGRTTARQLPNVELMTFQQGEDAVAAVSAARRADRPFAVAFIDLRMPPGLHGIETAEKIRAADPDVQIVIVTAYADVHPFEIAGQVPPADSLFFIQKPFNALEIQQFVNALSAKWRAEKAARPEHAAAEHLTTLHTVIGDCGELLSGAFDQMVAALDAVAPSSRSDARAAHAAGLDAAARIRRDLDRLRQIGLRTVRQAVVVDLGREVFKLKKELESVAGPDVSVTIASGPGLWPTALDPAHLLEALTELTANARDAMPTGGRLQIGITNRSSAPSGASKRDCVMIAVTDYGVGMNAELRHRALRPFFTTRRTQGRSGLGLSVVQSFVLQSSGEIEIDSQEGVGTTVRLMLPRWFEESAG